MDLERPLPQPMTPEARPYWDGLRQQRLMLPKCADCGHTFFYPRAVCPRCASRAIGWIEASGRGRLHAFGIAQQSFNRAFKVRPPYVLAMIELEEGPRLMSNLVNVTADPAHVRCDMPVEVVFERLTDEVTLPLFQPARPADRAEHGTAR
jgi:uncharacterized OB-fold protein